MDESGKITVNSDAYRKGLETYKLLYDAGATPSDSLSYEFAEANAAYTSGQVAAMMQWNAAASDLTSKEKSPAVADVTETAAPPAGPEGRFTHIHGLGFGLNKNAENKAGGQAVHQMAFLKGSCFDLRAEQRRPGTDAGSRSAKSRKNAPISSSSASSRPNTATS